MSKKERTITNILIMILLVTAIPSTTLPMVVSATSTSIKSELIL